MLAVAVSPLYAPATKPPMPVLPRHDLIGLDVHNFCAAERNCQSRSPKEVVVYANHGTFDSRFRVEAERKHKQALSF